MKTFERIATVVAILLLTWLLASFIDVLAHNLSTYQYAEWNAFVLMSQIGR